MKNFPITRKEIALVAGTLVLLIFGYFVPGALGGTVIKLPAATTQINTTITPTNLQTGLVGHWTFDGKNLIQNATDSSGQGNKGSLINFASTTTVPGKVGQGLSFDGVNDYVDLNDGFFNISQRSVSLWFKANLLQTAMVFSGGISTPNRWYMWPQSNGRIDHQIGTAEVVSSTATYSAGSWVHLVLTWDGSTGRKYINGVADLTGGTGLSGSANVNIGSYSNGGSNLWNGSIDDVRVYNRALSAEEVTRLYNLAR